MPYQTRRGEKRTTISVRLDTEALAAVDELASLWAVRDALAWEERMGRDPAKWKPPMGGAAPLPRGEVLRRAVANERQNARAALDPGADAGVPGGR